MKPIRVAVLALALLPLASLAAPPDTKAEAEQDVERQMRMARVLGLSEELELDSSQALKLDETLRKFDERRRPLRQQVRESAEVLERAANGDNAALSQVDQAAQRAFDAREQMAGLDREMFQAISKELPPQKRAKLALFMARFENRFSNLRHQIRDQVRERMRDKTRKLRDLNERD